MNLGNIGSWVCRQVQLPEDTCLGPYGNAIGYGLIGSSIITTLVLSKIITCKSKVKKLDSRVQEKIKLKKEFNLLNFNENYMKIRDQKENLLSDYLSNLKKKIEYFEGGISEPDALTLMQPFVVEIFDSQDAEIKIFDQKFKLVNDEKGKFNFWQFLKDKLSEKKGKLTDEECKRIFTPYARRFLDNYQSTKL